MAKHVKNTPLRVLVDPINHLNQIYHKNIEQILVPEHSFCSNLCMRPFHVNKRFVVEEPCHSI